jgi:ketosteroid isomerase-like protein
LIRDLVDAGEGRVFVSAERQLTAKLSGLEWSYPVFCLLVVRDGLITHFDEYLDRTQALAAAGLVRSSDRGRLVP